MNDLELLRDIAHRIDHYHGLVVLRREEGTRLIEIADRLERMRDLLTRAATRRETPQNETGS